jgi:hypothetical protein
MNSDQEGVYPAVGGRLDKWNLLFITKISFFSLIAYTYPTCDCVDEIACRRQFYLQSRFRGILWIQENVS